MRDGYGWSGGAGYVSDDNGVHIQTTTLAKKTIYIAEQKISPVYIFWQARIYGQGIATNTLTMTTTGLINNYNTISQSTPEQGEIGYIPEDGSILLTIEGYAIGTTVEINFTSSAAAIIYINSENGI